MDFDNVIREFALPVYPQGLYGPIRYALESNGKRLRPYMANLTYRLFGGKDDDVIYPVACALEIFHNFTLIHDDIMDKSDRRRGRETVYKKWDSNTAILSGDRMLILAYEFLLQSKIPPSDFVQILRYFNHMAGQLCEGQQLDADFEKRDVINYDDYLQMITYKTAVLFATSLRIGAFLSHGISEIVEEKIYHLGIKLGIAFQIQDDVLDVFGDAEKLGKPIGGDIISKKKSYPFIIALREGNKQLTNNLRTILESNLSNKEKIQQVTTLYKQLHIDEIGKKEVSELYNQISDDIQTFPCNKYREDLIEMIDLLIKRKN